MDKFISKKNNPSHFFMCLRSFLQSQILEGVMGIRENHVVF